MLMEIYADDLCLGTTVMIYGHSQTSFIQTAWCELKSDCETCGLLNHCKQKMIESRFTRKCVRVVRHTV